MAAALEFLCYQGQLHLCRLALWGLQFLIYQLQYMP